MDQQIRIVLPNDIALICAVRNFIRTLATRLGFHPSRVDDIELVVDELCNNAMEHGSDPHSSISLIITLRDHVLDILVRDEGKGGEGGRWLSRIDSIRRRRNSPLSERGHGIYLVEILADHLVFCENEMGGTDVRAIFFKLDEVNDGEERRRSSQA